MTSAQSSILGGTVCCATLCAALCASQSTPRNELLAMPHNERGRLQVPRFAAAPATGAHGRAGSREGNQKENAGC
jgi:hypothetical protein